MARMIARPNAIVDVFRDADADAPVFEQDVDEYGDPVDTAQAGPDVGGLGAPHLGAEPALIVSETVQANVDGDLRVIRRPIARMRPGLDVREGDRLRDGDGAIYAVETVERPRFSPTRALDIRLELVRTS